MQTLIYLTRLYADVSALVRARLGLPIIAVSQSPVEINLEQFHFHVPLPGPSSWISGKGTTPHHQIVDRPLVGLECTHEHVVASPRCTRHVDGRC